MIPLYSFSSGDPINSGSCGQSAAAAAQSFGRTFAVPPASTTCKENKKEEGNNHTEYRT
jgi:hypothetical protein